MTRLVVGLDVVAFLVFGGWGLFAPASLAEVVGFGLDGHAAVTEIRATYGGLELGLAAALSVGLARPAHARSALALAALAFAGFATGRCVGLAVDGMDTTHAGIAAIEVAAAVLNGVAWRRAGTP